MSRSFEVHDGVSAVVLTEAQIRQMAGDGRITPNMLIRRGSGEWVPMSTVKGLCFKPNDLNPVNEIECPFCSETIKASAKKCKHCGEFIPAISEDVVVDNQIDLDAVALNQSRSRWCGFASFMLPAFAIILAIYGPYLIPVSSSVLVAFVGGSWLLYYTTVLFAVFLAAKIYDTSMTVALGLLGLIPYLGSVAVVAIDARASGVLRRHNRNDGPSWLAVAFPAMMLSPGVFYMLNLAFVGLYRTRDLGIVGPASTSAMFATTVFFGGVLILVVSRRKQT